MKDIMLMVHFGIAGLLHSPKWKLTENEAERLGTAWDDVLSLYDVAFLTPEMRAWGMLAFTAGCIYIPRLSKDKQPAPEASKEQSPGRVVSMPMQPVGSVQ
jgi:hypothetical protein